MDEPAAPTRCQNPDCGKDMPPRVRAFGTGRVPLYCCRACRPSSRESAAARTSNPRAGRARASRVEAGRPPGTDPATCDREYTDREVAWLRACDAYRREKRRGGFLRACDYLRVAEEVFARAAAGPTGDPGGEDAG